MLEIQWYILSVSLNSNYDMVFGGYDKTGTLLCAIGIFLLAEKADTYISWNNIVVSIFHYVGSNTIFVYYIHWILGYTVLINMHFKHGFVANFLKTSIFLAIGSLLGEGVKFIQKCLRENNVS